MDIRDSELIYAGNLNHSDGLSDYEEYRGLVIQGAWTTTGRDCPDVFIHDRDSLGTGSFGQTGLHINLVAAADSNGAGEITFNSPPATWPCTNNGLGVAQRRLLLRQQSGNPQQGFFGFTLPFPPGLGPPFRVSSCEVYPDVIDAWLMQKFGNTSHRQRVIGITITHELAHGVSIVHHPTSGSDTCFMKYVSVQSLNNALGHTEYANDFPHLTSEMRLK